MSGIFLDSKRARKGWRREGRVPQYCEKHQSIKCLSEEIDTAISMDNFSRKVILPYAVQLLVDLAIERDADIPALVYEARPTVSLQLHLALP